MLFKKEAVAVVTRAGSPMNLKDRNNNNNNNSKRKGLLTCPHLERAETYGRQAHAIAGTADLNMAVLTREESRANISSRAPIAPTSFQV
jgi:hypothetical protein